MKFRIQLVAQHTDGGENISEIATLEREDLTNSSLGLSLTEAKTLLLQLQHEIVRHQVDEFINDVRACSCGKDHKFKGHHHISYRTLFGKIKVSSPRFYTCCDPDVEHNSFSPLTRKITDRTSPELLYLESKWASLMSYGMTSELLNDLLPISSNSTTVYNHTQKIAQRLEDEVEQEEHFYVAGCEMDWAELPMPEMPLIVGIDGGYIRERQDNKRKAGNCEVIVGKSIPYNGKGKCFAYVSGDDRPKRRLHNLLKSQGMQNNQNITFLSDGGENVRNLQFHLSPQAEHLLDWFHITMRITVIRQMMKGLQPHPDMWFTPDKMHTQMERVKWFLWHGNCYQALQILYILREPLEIFFDQKNKYAKTWKKVHELIIYIENNRSFIPNYGERHRHGERISTGFIESAVNQVIAKRFAKKQQMRWTRQGAHYLLQIRVKVINEDLQSAFRDWYPDFEIHSEEMADVA
ncbi:MAG: hypothetical protein Phog2KO_41740 [Phototrophicaceae bacterium]